MGIIQEIIDGNYPPKTPYSWKVTVGENPAPELSPCIITPPKFEGLSDMTENWLDSFAAIASERMPTFFDESDLYSAAPQKWMLGDRVPSSKYVPEKPRVLDLMCGYMEAVHDPKRLLERATELILDDLEFDTIVGTGLSGTIAATELARKLDKNYLIVRKDNDGSHSSLPVEGRLGKSWLFVDDTTASGRTFCRVWDKVTNISREKSFDTEFVGTFLYADRQFLKPRQCHHGWLEVQSEIYNGELDGPEGSYRTYQIY